MAFTTLAHHIDVAFLREAFARTRKDGATGVDGQTAEEYAENLEGNLQSLLDRFKSGTYQAPPVRRVNIPKGDGKTTRPLGIPTFEDKVLQRAVAMVLEAIYEQDFLPCSFGFRPGRSAHQALADLWQSAMAVGGGWVLDVDVQRFFDTLDHGHLRGFLDRRVRDGVLRRALDKWLKAGVLESGGLTYPEAGTPQGGVISPLLANVFLHEVLDTWFEEQVRPRLQGRGTLIRYADDFVIVLELEADARRVMTVLPKRFGKYGLTLHPEKTHLVPFRRPPGKPGSHRRDARPGTFDFLGFTLHWGISRKGFWVVRRRTARSRFSRTLKRIADWCRTHRHMPVSLQHAHLVQKVRGHDAYYGLTGNGRALVTLRHHVRWIWRRWLSRRSQRARITWLAFAELSRRFPLPPARVVHSVYRAAKS
jgi:group II intron reverse transcriptase/maturase